MDKRHRSKGFAEGNGVDRVRNYFVEPDAEELIERLVSGEYVVLQGARQTGKTTTVFHALDVLESSSYNCINVDFPAQSSTVSSLAELWRLITERVYESSDGKLSIPDFSGIDYEAYFRRLFKRNKVQQGKDTILVFDEVNHFCRIPNAFKDSFLNNLRELKQNGRSRLLSLMLVGTSSILEDLRIANKYRKCLGVRPSSGIGYSPFTNDALFESKSFTREEVWQLIAQFADHKKVNVEKDVSETIWNCTGGRKGLVGVCCALLAGDRRMREFGHISGSMWSNFAKLHLIDNVFQRPTYNAMWENCHALQGEELKLLLSMLQNGGTLKVKWKEHWQLLGTIYFLISEGILVDTDNLDGFSTLQFSCELLHSFLLKQLCVEGEDLPVGIGPTAFDRMWVIQRTIEVLDLDVLQQPESCNAEGNTSEYALQFEFFVKLKKVLKVGYPYLQWKVIPEAKYWRQRLELLAKDGDTVTWFAFEFLRQGTLATLLEHYKRALWFAEVHSCIVYMINFVLEGDGVEFKGEEGAPVIVYNVVIRGREARMAGGWFADGGFKDVKLQLSNIRTKLAWSFE